MPRLDLESTIALGVSQWGVRWPNQWWPGQDNDANDCAAFVSWLLFGLSPAGGPLNIWVSDLQLRNGMEFHAGSDGIRRGDIPGWYWSGGSPGNYDHTGIVTRVVGDTVYSLDANSGPGDQVGEYGRNRGYITSYVRPAYPGFAGIGTPPIEEERRKKQTMIALVHGDAVPGIIFCLHLDTHQRSWVPYGPELTAWTALYGYPISVNQAQLDAIPWVPGQTLWNGNVTT